MGKAGDLGFWGRAGAAGSANEAETYPKLSALCHPGKTSAIEAWEGLVVPKRVAPSWITPETAQERGQKGANPKNPLRTTNGSAAAAPALSRGHRMGPGLNKNSLESVKVALSKQESITEDTKTNFVMTNPSHWQR